MKRIKEQQGDLEDGDDDDDDDDGASRESGSKQHTELRNKILYAPEKVTDTAPEKKGRGGDLRYYKKFRKNNFRKSRKFTRSRI